MSIGNQAGHTFIAWDDAWLSRTVESMIAGRAPVGDPIKKMEKHFLELAPTRTAQLFASTPRAIPLLASIH
ncbi:MAG TPA: hypothetical protein VMJ35_14250 [Dongiaceae bacterium]|nr:hypothetical protein [Dongiaceae bacterium]